MDISQSVWNLDVSKCLGMAIALDRLVSDSNVESTPSKFLFSSVTFMNTFRQDINKMICRFFRWAGLVTGIILIIESLFLYPDDFINGFLMALCGAVLVIVAFTEIR